MESNQKQHCRKKTYTKVGFELKLFIIDQIQNIGFYLYYF